MPDAITHLAPAKLNLALAVGPPRDDGMHPICSWMVTVGLCDELSLTRLDAGSLSRYAIMWHRDAIRRSEIDWSVARDIAVKAHVALQKELGRDLPVQLKLDKKIPVGGGLGGGSSDAAAMLRGLNELFELKLSVDDLAAIGATIGSDVPYLVHGGGAIVTGLGELIERQAKTPDLHAVLVFPEFGCDTGRVYGAFDTLITNAEHSLRIDDIQALAASASGVPHDHLFNDLAAAAFDTAPRLAGYAEKFEELAERRAHVSGSGSSLFVICDDAMHAEALAATVKSQLDLQAVATTTHHHSPASIP